MAKKRKAQLPSRTLMIRGTLPLRPSIEFVGVVPSGREKGATVLSEDPPANCLVFIPHPTEDALFELRQVSQLGIELTVSLDERIVNGIVDGALELARIGPPPDEALGIQTVLHRASEAAANLESSGAVDGLRACYVALRTAINRVLSLVKDDFGQYWIDTVDPYWETEEVFGRIGEFLRHISAEFSVDGVSWSPLHLPINQRGAANWIPLADLMTTDSWGLLVGRVNSESNLSLHLVSRARSAFMRHDHRTAVITMMTAVEREVVLFVQRELAAKGVELSEKDMRAMSRLYGLTFILETMAPKFATDSNQIELIKLVKKVVELRNDLVHGKEGERDMDSRVARGHMDSCIDLLRWVMPSETPVHWFNPLPG